MDGLWCGFSEFQQPQYEEHLELNAPTKRPSRKRRSQFGLLLTPHSTASKSHQELPLAASHAPSHRKFPCDLCCLAPLSKPKEQRAGIGGKVVVYYRSLSRCLSTHLKKREQAKAPHVLHQLAHALQSEIPQFLVATFGYSASSL